MKAYVRFSAAILSMFCTLGAVSVFAGPGLTGGGNWQEADFALSARTLFRILEADRKRSQAALGINLNELDNTMKSTEVHCAINPVLKKMKRLNKLAYFDADEGNIFLNCERYGEVAPLGSPKQVMILHEYMRKLKNEGSEYNASANLSSVFINITVNVKIQPMVIQPKYRYSFQQCLSIASSNYYEKDKVRQKWNCLSKFAQAINLDQCLSVAKSNYYENDKVRMKEVCMNLTSDLDECVNSVASTNYYENTKVEMKKSCLNKFEGLYDFNQCINVANSNYYQNEKTNFKEYCLDHMTIP